MTDYFKLSAEELRTKDAAELRTTAQEIRKSLAHTRMDIYSASAVNAGKVKKLKKALARVLTVTSEKSRVKA